METWLVVLIGLNLLFTNYLWQQTRRGPTRKFRRSLMSGGPITPKHTRPAGLSEGWGINDGDLQFFEDFDLFGDVLNRTLEDEPWRVQEMSKTEISGLDDTPLYGRRYAIFYNQHKLGTLQIYAIHPYSASEPIVRTEIELDFARLIPFHSISGFVSSIAMFTASRGIEEMDKAARSAQGAAINTLWRIEYDPELDDRSSGGDIEFQFDGSAENYLRVRTLRTGGTLGMPHGSRGERWSGSGS